MAQHSGQLNDAITQLAGASSGLVSLLVPNLQPLEADVGTVTTVGRTLDRNLSSVDEILQNGNNLFQGAARAYDPSYNWLNLNLATAPGVTGAYIAGLLRDRLAGICRRIVANHSTGLSAAVIATLNQCGNPSSGFFNPLLNDIPTILDTLNGGSGSATAQSLLQQGLTQIANAEQGAKAAPPTPSPTPAQNAPAATTTTTTTTTVPKPTTTTTTTCGLLGAVLGCSGNSSSGSGSSSSGGSGSSSSGLGGLLSDQATRDSNRPTSTLAVAGMSTPNTDPTLTAPAASLLPPLPQTSAPRRTRAVASCRSGSTTSKGGSDALRARPASAPGRGALLGRAGRGPRRLLSAGGGRQRTATAVFTDVGDLSNGAQVQLADVPVGSVRSIALDGDKAKVTLSFDNGVRIPADVSAAINRTTILGDQFVQLDVPKNETGAAAATAPQLADGARIAHTSLVPDVEQFVQAGSEVFGAISTTELEQIIEAGGEGFTGQEASLEDVPGRLVGGGHRLCATHQRHHPGRRWPRQPHRLPGSGERRQRHRAVEPVPDGGHPGQELVAVRDPPAVPRQLVLPGAEPPRELLPPDRDPVANPAGGQQPGGAAPGRPGGSPLRDPCGGQRPAAGGPERLRAALREHHRLRPSWNGRGQLGRLHLRAAFVRGRFLVITRRLVVNLIVFFAVSFALVAYGVVNLLGNPLQSPTMLTTHFADASGLYSGFEVELNGVPVGTVTSTALTTTATKVTMRINPGTSVPDDVQSSVQIANDLGEQVVNLVPSRAGAAPALKSGAEVPAAPDQVPANVGAVVASATRLLRAIPGDDLNKLIGELATSLSGQAGNLRTLISAGTTFSRGIRRLSAAVHRAPGERAPTLDAITAVAPELRQDLANTAALVQVLAQQKSGLHTLLTSGSSAFNAVDNLVTSQSANLGCVLHDTANILTNIAEPTNLNNLSQGLAYNQSFFGAVDSIAVAGVAKPTTTGGKDTNQTFLRTRLLIPPVLDEQAQSYSSASTIPDTLPGAACVTAFGNGVGAATQPGFTPAAGGHVVAPSAQEADVEVASATPVGQVSSASYRVPADRQGLMLALGGLVVPALFLAWGARPARRRTRAEGLREVPDAAVAVGSSETRRETGDMTMTETTTGDGVKVVGAPTPDGGEPSRAESSPRARKRRPSGDGGVPSRRAFRLTAFLAVIGLVGTLVFGILYTTKSGSGPVQDPAVVSACRGLPDGLLQFQRQDGRRRLQRGRRHGDRRLCHPGPAVLQRVHPQGARAGLGRVARPDPLRRRAVGERGCRHGVGLRRGRPDLRQQQDHLAPGRCRPVGRRSQAGGRGLEDLRRDRARGGDSRQHGQRLGLGGLERPWAIGSTVRA